MKNKLSQHGNLSTGDLLLILTVIIFFIVNKDGGYLNYALSLLFLYLFTPLNKYLNSYINFNSNDVKVLLKLPILLTITFLFHFNLSDNKNRIKELEKGLSNKTDVIRGMSEIQKNDTYLIKVDSIWTNIKSLSSVSKEELEDVRNTVYIKVIGVTKSDIQNNNYEKAIENLKYLQSEGYADAELFYLFGLAYHGLNDKVNSINFLKISSEKGNEKAYELYDKLNPLKKRISNYVTLCCDGSISYSVGRGTCSWHGGVCQWNYPIYEEYRDY